MADGVRATEPLALAGDVVVAVGVTAVVAVATAERVVEAVDVAAIVADGEATGTAGSLPVYGHSTFPM